MLNFKCGGSRTCKLKVFNSCLCMDRENVRALKSMIHTLPALNNNCSDVIQRGTSTPTCSSGATDWPTTETVQLHGSALCLCVNMKNVAANNIGS